MKQKVIALHLKDEMARPVMMESRMARAFASPISFAQATIEIDEVEERHMPSFLARPGINAVAPVMPLRLIEPVAEDLNVEVTAAQAWGIEAVGAHATPFSGKGISVAVLDTGIDIAHPAFAHLAGAIHQQDFTGEGNADTHGHGTHCAGTIFGGAVNGMRIGVAPGIKKALIAKVLGGSGGGSDTIANAILWAVQQGANILSMSLGIDFPGYVAELERAGMPPEMAASVGLSGYRANVLLFEKLAAYVQATGALQQTSVLIAAAGNESRRDVNPDFEVAVAPPAVADGFVSVAALGQTANGLKVADFSNTGAKVSGPGVAIVSAKTGGGLVAFSGTSMATPHVAGVAALWAEKLNSAGMLNAFNLTARLVASGRTDVLIQGFDPADVGSGIVCAPQN